MTSFHLRFPLADVPHWAGRYSYPGEALIAATVAPAARARGYLTHDDLVALGRWKSPRIGPRIAANDPAYVADVTAIALGVSSEQLRVEVLLLLSGVGWPMASVILHWCHRDDYPILDYRALWSLSAAPPRYDFPLWRDYTLACRDLAGRAGVSLRELDRALWQYSSENQ